MARTYINILDNSLNLITTIRSPMPINSQRLFTYSKELSDFGKCTFRISAYDPILTKYGDIVAPHANHVRIMRDNVVVWSGAIIENTKRTKDYIEVIAAEYEWYLSRVLVNRSSINPSSGKSDNIYRIFKSGTMGTAITNVINETITTFKSISGKHPLSNMTVGTVETPNYPPNTSTAVTPIHPLNGPYTFGDGIHAPQMQFDFHPVLYLLKSMANVSYADFEIDENLAFNFKIFLGRNKPPYVNLVYGKFGNTYDFNIPRLGQQMANDLIGIATDVNGNILHNEQTDETSITKNGLIQTVAAYSDVKDQATLNARVIAELPLISEPEESPITFVLTEKAPPFGLYQIGDIVNVKVEHDFANFSATKRIVGISVSVDDTGRELTTVQMNTPLPFQYTQETS